MVLHSAMSSCHCGYPSTLRHCSTPVTLFNSQVDLSSSSLPPRPVHPFTQSNESSQSPTFITSQKPTTQNATTVSSSTKSWCLYLASSSLYNLSSENNCFSSRCPSLALAESHSYSFINIYWANISPGSCASWCWYSPLSVHCQLSLFFGSLCSMQDLVPRTGIKPEPPAMEAWSLNHWTTGKASVNSLLNKSFLPY